MDLPSNLTLADYQLLIRDLVVERGFDKETVSEVLCFFLKKRVNLPKPRAKCRA